MEGNDIQSYQNYWAQLPKQNPKMPSLPKEKIIQYVVNYKNGKTNRWDEKKAKQLDNQEFKSLKIIPVREVINKKELPLIYWMKSTQDILTKVVAAAALITVLTTIGLTIQKLHRDHERDIAFARLYELQNQEEDHQKILDEAALFLDNPPLLGTDARTTEVTAIYEKELAKWFMEKDAVDKQQFSAYLKRYKRITNQTPEK